MSTGENLQRDLQLIEQYIADMQFRNLLAGTIRVRRSYLTKFAKEVGFSEATQPKIIGWLGSRNISAKTRSMWLSTLSAFYKWAAKNSVFPTFVDPNTGAREDFNPVKKIDKPRLHGRNPRPMADDDLKRALDVASPLMKCWLLLGCFAGCRCQEIAGISREDVRDDLMVLHIVHGKGDKERYVSLHPDILEALNALPMRETGRLWDESPQSMSRKINRFLHKLGINSTAHTLRHWFGTKSYQGSNDLRLVQTMMGHASPTTTAVYAAADQSKAAPVVNKLTI